MAHQLSYGGFHAYPIHRHCVEAFDSRNAMKLVHYFLQVHEPICMAVERKARHEKILRKGENTAGVGIKASAMHE